MTIDNKLSKEALLAMRTIDKTLTLKNSFERLVSEGTIQGEENFESAYGINKSELRKAAHVLEGYKDNSLIETTLRIAYDQFPYLQQPQFDSMMDEMGGGRI